MSSKEDSSIDSSESDGERRSKLVGYKELGQHINDANMQRIERLSRDKSVPGQEGFSSDDGETSSQQNHAEFEYMETDPPFARQPLADKVPEKVVPRKLEENNCVLLWPFQRWYTCLNTECNKGGWSTEEDMLLCEAGLLERALCLFLCLRR